MAHVLYIESSPRKLRSASIEVAQAALSAWRKADPKLTVDTLDVWSTKLPEFDGPLMEAKYAGLAGTPLTKEQDLAWSALREIAERFLAADALVFAVPLWNFGIPYKLKHLVDLVTQKDLLFSFDGQAFGGLLSGRRALLIYARGLDYGPGGLPAMSMTSRSLIWKPGFASSASPISRRSLSRRRCSGLRSTAHRARWR